MKNVKKMGQKLFAGVETVLLVVLTLMLLLAVVLLSTRLIELVGKFGIWEWIAVGFVAITFIRMFIDMTIRVFANNLNVKEMAMCYSFVFALYLIILGGGVLLGYVYFHIAGLFW